MIVYGKNVAKELLENNAFIHKIYLWEDFDDKKIKTMINKSNFSVEIMTKKQLNQLVKERHQGIIIEIDNYIFISFEKIIEDETSKFIVILDHIEDPHNFGAIIRTCECAGVDYIIIPKKGQASITPTVMKTSAGALTSTKICEVTNLRNAVNKLKEKEYWIVGAEADGEDYADTYYGEKTALIIGSEGKGIKYIIKESCDSIASIPLKGNVNSLNASVAAGIMIYEIIKRK